MAEPIEFCLHELIPHSTVSHLQPRAITGFYCPLTEPMIGFSFVAKYQLCLALNQLNIIDFLTHLRPIDDGWRHFVLALFCATAGVYPRLIHALAGLPK